MKDPDMTRDYSKFLPPAMQRGPSPLPLSALQSLGWQPYFAQQTSVDELDRTPPVRITAVYRNAWQIRGEDIDDTIPPVKDATIGDWLLLNRDRPSSSHILERKSLLKRRAPGTGRQEQRMGANIDTAFIVTSCNADFNIARLERYVALAFEAKVTPVIVITKTDLCDTPEDFTRQARTISDLVTVVALDARGDEARTRLADWCKPGKTVAFLGSSGVGKSTLTNALLGTSSIATQGIREDDAKGRHTTTHRELHLVPGCGLVLDMPGMRELQLSDTASGIDDLFADIRDLSSQCRFRDCEHLTEPSCAVQNAIHDGTLDPARLRRWRKLMAEDAFNSASLAERRRRDKAFGKMVRDVKRIKKQSRRDE